MSGKRYTDKDRKRAVQLYKQGWSMAKITREPGLPNDPKILRRWLQEMDVQLRESNPQHYPRKKILQDLQAGYDRQSICEHYGCSLKYLTQLSTGKLQP